MEDFHYNAKTRKMISLAILPSVCGSVATFTAQFSKIDRKEHKIFEMHKGFVINACLENYIHPGPLPRVLISAVKNRCSHNKKEKEKTNLRILRFYDFLAHYI